MQPVPELKLGAGIDDGRDRLDVVVPSWLLSIVSHILLFFVIALILRGCSSSGTVGPKVGDGTFRVAGRLAPSQLD